MTNLFTLLTVLYLGLFKNFLALINCHGSTNLQAIFNCKESYKKRNKLNKFFAEFTLDFYSITFGGIYSGLDPLGGVGGSGRRIESDFKTNLINSCFLFSVLGLIGAYELVLNKLME